MNIWHLPGPSEYLSTVERSIRNGESVILRFPEGAPTGAETALHARLEYCGRWRRVVVSPPTESMPVDPLRHLFSELAPELSTMPDLTPVELCEEEGFRGCVIWIDGLCSINCCEWIQFLENYSQVSQNISRLWRTMFIVPVSGDAPEASRNNVALSMHDWATVVDEMDLVVLANNRLRARGFVETIRKLLVITIAQVAAWDCAVAEGLAQARMEDILDPLEFLKSDARGRGWTRETPPSVALGTESYLGVAHAALAAIREPSEIRRRIWSAQVSVLLPVIEMQRRQVIREHRHQITAELRQKGRPYDPETLEIGDLAPLLSRACFARFDQEVVSRVERLRFARNELAHGRPLPISQALELV